MRLVPRKKIKGKNKELNSLYRRTADVSDSKKELAVLYRAQNVWDGLYSMREERKRNLKFTYGEQYADIVEVDGERMSEGEYWGTQGVIPKKNNLIGKMVRSVIGVYKNQDTAFSVVAIDREEQQAGEMMTSTLQANRDVNLMNEIELSLFREFIISATVFTKEEWGWKKRRKDSWTSIVDPNLVFFDGTMQDVRHWDCDIIGQIHDMSRQEVKTIFAKSPKQARQIDDIYSQADNQAFLKSNYQQIYRNKRENSGSFYTPQNSGMCRVIEVWTKEQRPMYQCHDYNDASFYLIEEDDLHTIAIENKKRQQQALEEGIEGDEIPYIECTWVMAEFWYYRFLSPLGDVLQEGETPFEHKEHPYTMKVYPFIDGKPHSLVEDSIDQQKFVNELITLYMLMAKHSAKGLLMFPEQLLGDNSPEDIAEEFTKVNGMFVYRPKEGVPLPQQLATNVSNFNISELLQIEMNMFEEVTGITGAMTGKTPNSGIAASLYAQQSQNASNTLVDILFTFSNFLKEVYNKKLSNINQYYTEERVIMVAGARYGGVRKYMPNLAKDTTFDVMVSEGMSTPEYKQAINDMLIGMYERQIIDKEQLFKFGDFPKGEAILQDMLVKEQNAEQQMEQQGGNPAQQGLVQ